MSEAGTCVGRLGVRVLNLSKRRAVDQQSKASAEEGWRLEGYSSLLIITLKQASQYGLFSLWKKLGSSNGLSHPYKQNQFASASTFTIPHVRISAI